MKILLFGAFANGNIGDELQAQCLARTILEKFPHARITANSHFSRDFHFTLGEKAPFGRIYDLDYVNSFDRLIIGGGGLLAHPHDPLADERWVDGLTVPVIIWGVGASDYFAGDARKLIAKAHYASGRDLMSIEALARYRSDVPFVCDPVLADKGTDSVRGENEDNREGTLWVLRGPLTKVHDKVLRYMRPGDTVVGFEPKVDNAIEGMFPQITYPETLEQFAKLAARAKRVISMRFHGIILALNCGVPVAALDVGKGLDLLRMLGLQRSVITGEDWNVDFPIPDGERTKAIVASMRQFYRLQLEIALSPPKAVGERPVFTASDADADYMALEQQIGALIDSLSPSAALAFAHRQANGNLSLATMLAQIAHDGADRLEEGEKLSVSILLASLLERGGDLANALRMISQALEISPDNQQALNDKNRILSEIARTNPM